MKIEYDADKNQSNIKERNLPFDDADYFDFSTSVIWVDTRFEYGEVRYLAIGYLDDRLHILCFAKIDGGIRVISFRKANKREAKKHGFALTQNT